MAAASGQPSYEWGGPVLDIHLICGRMANRIGHVRDSCNTFLNRDPDSTAKFLDRHQDKLMFGRDCPCSDGRGGGNTNPSPRLHGKCIARERLAAVQRMPKPEVFRKIRWNNGVQLLGLQA